MKRVVILVAAFAVSVRAAGVRAGEGLNPYKGRQSRAEKFEFAAKPELKKQGGKYVITFASRAACDATVAIVNPKGKIVRHLASGVLGKNAPWPFKQGSLSQSIEWDGKDDFGKPVPQGCKVRVGLGLKASHDRSLGWTPAKAMERTGMAVDRDGRLFILDGSIVEGGAVCFSVKVYDREGRYLRQIAPPPANMAGKAGYIAWNKTIWGSRVPRTTLGYHGTTLTSNYYLGTLMARQTPVVTRDGRFVLLSAQSWKQTSRVLVTIDGRDGNAPRNGYATIDKDCKAFSRGEAGTPLHMALSPDDKWLYIGAPEGVKGRHGVHRVDMTKPGPAKLFLGSLSKPGKDEKHFNSPRGVACDGKGNIYVADRGNDRIQVFKPDGSFLKSLPVKKPNQLAVHRKTGEVYVLQFVSKGKWRSKIQLVKLGGLKDPAVKLKGPQMGFRHGHLSSRSPLMALDDGGEKTYVWLKGDGNGITRYRDEGASLKRMPSGEVNGGVKGWERWEPWAHQCQIAADPVREELYIREQGMCGAGAMIRVGGRTGKVLDRCGQRDCGLSTPLGIENVGVGPGGRVYYRTGHRGEWLTCYDPKTKKLVPPPKAVWTKKQQGSVEYKGKPYKAIYIPGSGGGRTFQDMMGVGLNGDLYIPSGILRGDIPRLKKAGLDYPKDQKAYCDPFKGSLLEVYSADGKLKCLSALPGLGPSQGVSAGRNGAVYIALECVPAGAKLPEGLAPGSRVHGNSWGTVFKFDSRTGKYPVGRINGRWAKGLKGKATHRWLNGGFKHAQHGAGPVSIENAVWEYPGLGVFKGTSCNCPKSNLSMDGFERCFVPALHTCTVNVLDANGNIVVRIGGYGNADSRGKDSPVKDPKTGELRPRRESDPKDLVSPLAEPEIGFCNPNFTAVTDEAVYVHDRGNERIVRAKLGYHAEETVALSWASASASVRTSPAPKLPETAVVSAAPAGGKASAGKPAAGSAGKRPVAENKQIVMARKCKHWINMAKNYARAGMSGKAREYLRKVISGYPQSSFADSARKRLQALR